MRNVILCEGKTDAVLISYFLKTFGWEPKKSGARIAANTAANEETYWYARDGRTPSLTIHACGGYTNVPTRLSNVLH